MKRLSTLLLLTVAVVAAWAQPTAVKNRAFFEGITYQWPFNAPTTAQQSSNLGQVATDPDQIIAMLREIYTNRNIPGNYARGYSAVGVNEGTWASGVATGNYPVAYPAVGALGMSNNTFEYFRFNDSYGWNIPGTIKTSEGKGSVTFRANNQADRARFNSIKKSGITVKATDMCYTYGSTSNYNAYYSVNKNDTLVITAAPGRKITKVTLAFRSSDYNGGAAANFYNGRASKVYKVMTKQCYITQIDVEYEAEAVTEVPTNATFPDFYSDSETVRFTPGINYGVGYSSANSGNRANQGAFGIGYMSSMGTNTSTYYRANNSSTQWFFTQEGYIMTNFKLTFESATYGTSNIKSISYLALDGSTYTTITANTTPSLSDFLTSATTMEFTLPTNYVSITPNNSTSDMHITSVEATYVYNKFNDIYLAYDTYVPNEEGNTLLLVEVKDGVTPATLQQSGLATFTNNTFDNYNITDYNSLRNVVDATIKSVRVVTEAKRMGEGTENAGTLFKIDCDKLNRFFLLGKGQLRWFDNDYNTNAVNASTPPRSSTQYTEGQPFFLAGTTTSSNLNQTYTYDRSKYFDQSMEYLFGHMFEQFSPSMASGGSSLNDIYKLLAVNMQSFNVVHDCIDVLSAESTGHEFNMYGKTSTSDDCQDVRDMMFFIPDYRMLAHNGNSTVSKRDPYKAQKFLYYNPDHAPKMGLFVIKLDEITEDKAVKVEGEDAYDVTLTWNSNLLNFLPGEDGVYNLYRVTNVDGVETYTPVKDSNGNDVTITANTQAGLTYTDCVAQLPNEGQTITYVVRGRDAGNFLSLQMSNKESVYIPGIDVSEDLNLKLKADYYSRFDPQEEKNNYSNLVTMGTVVSNITGEELKQGTLTFTRAYTDATGNHCDPIAVGTVTNLNQSTKKGTMKVTMQNQDFFMYGYNSNGTASASAPNPSFNVTFTYNANGVTFNGDGIKFYDNFSASVAGNTHPSKYTYQVNFVFGDKFANSNTMDIYVHKTQLVMDPEGKRSVTAAQIASDEEKINRALPANAPVEFGIDVKYSSKSEILRYDAYRWPNTAAPRYIIEPSSAANNEQDVAPNGIAGNQGTYYTTAMNAVAGANVPVTEGQTAQALFTDPYPVTNIGTYFYAPVVETFAPNEDRSDYNTYGAPLQQAATGKVAVSVKEPFVDEEEQLDYSLMSDHTWEVNGDKYAYYNIYLQVDQSSIPAGYSIYKVRAWRKVDPSLLGEEYSKYYYRMGTNGEYLYEELDNVQLREGDLLGTGKDINGQVKCTFGARKLRTSADETGVIDELKAEFVVRVYFTAATPAGAPVLKADGDAKYYVMETPTERTFDWKDGVVTGVAQLTTSGDVQGVTYYNVAGAASSQPWQGVNIVVTRYSDGTSTTTKVVK